VQQAHCPAAGRITQGFHGRHDGIDIANSRGTPIYAVGPGTVTFSAVADPHGYGQYIIIHHDDGSATQYGHMYQRHVRVGDRVSGGQQIALMGSEGGATGVHLHLRTYNRASDGHGIDPILYLRDRGLSMPCVPGATEDDMDGDTFIKQASNVVIGTIPGGTINMPFNWWLSAIYAHIIGIESVVRATAHAVTSVDGVDDQAKAQVEAARQDLANLKAALLEGAQSTSPSE